MTGTDAYVSGITYSRLGKVTAMTYGNGLVTNYDYYDTTGEVDPSSGTTYSYRMKSVQVGAAGSVMNLSYTYDKNGNVKTRTDGLDATHSEAYTYDDLNRLLTANSTVYGSLNYAYDAIDNITSFEGKTYSYNTNGVRPHAVTGNSVFTYLYDANGNMTNRSDGRTMAYDGYNRVSSISDGGSYEYSDGEQRVKKTEGTITTYYFFGSYEEEYTSGTLSNVVKYYSANGQSVAQRSSTEGLVYVHSDHLGSSSVLTNAAGAVVLRRGFKPYGEQAYQTGTAATKYQFTGQEKESNGLYYYGARYYDPSLGRFTSADTVLDGLNRYAYCWNNPVKYTDPTGFEHAWDGSPYDVEVEGYTSLGAFVPTDYVPVTNGNGRSGGTDAASIPAGTGEQTKDDDKKPEVVPTPTNGGSIGNNGSVLPSPFVDHGLLTGEDTGGQVVNQLGETAGKLTGAYQYSMGYSTWMNGQYGYSIGWYIDGLLNQILLHLGVNEFRLMGLGARAGIEGVVVAASNGAKAVDIGLAREAKVAELEGGVVSREEMKIYGPDGMKTDLDVIAGNGDLIWVGGAAKMGNLGWTNRVLGAYKLAAAELGVGARAYLPKGTPKELIDFVTAKLGRGNVSLFKDVK